MDIGIDGKQAIIKEVFKNEVFPALGCTEPIAVAYAASIAAHEMRARDIDEIAIIVDPGLYKNGIGVTIPYTNGAKGNLIAGVIGALIGKPALEMQILTEADQTILEKAGKLIAEKKARIDYDKSKSALYIDVTVKSGSTYARAVVENTHSNLTMLEKNGSMVYSKNTDTQDSKEYKKKLMNMSISDLIDCVQAMDADDYRGIEKGIQMNLKISKAGIGVKKVGYHLLAIAKKTGTHRDPFASSKIMVSSATDARMAGLHLAVMTSGCSGNQGILSILVPYNIGKIYKIEKKTVLRSIALAHLINSYVKCFTGSLSPLCGCAIAAGVGVCAALVYQRNGKDPEKMNFAVNNLIGDLGGILCDGAKDSCALKIASSAESSIRSAYFALNNYGIHCSNGILGKTAEETIRYLNRVCTVGMAKVNDAILEIMTEKM